MSQKQDGNSLTDNPMLLVALGLAALLLVWIIWMSIHTEVAAIYVYIRYLELYVINFIGTYLDIPVVSHAKNWLVDVCDPDPNKLLGLCRKDFSIMEWEELTNSSMIFNLFILPYILYKCIKLFIFADRNHPKLKYARQHNLASFINEQKELHPHLIMFSKIDLISKSLTDPIYGMSLTSRQFCTQHDLIEGWEENKDKSFTPNINIAKAKIVFTKQLGLLWKGKNFKYLSKSEVLLLAISIPRVAATNAELNDDEFQTAMNDSKKMISYCWSQFKPPDINEKRKKEKSEVKDTWLYPEIDVSEAEKLISHYYRTSETVRAVFRKHAYVRTIIVGMFMQARRLGVLPPAEMRWLKFYDREMWHILQSIGRQSYYAEGAGVLGHYLYEFKIGEGYPEPLLDKVIEGLITAVHIYKFEANDIKIYNKNVKKLENLNK
ncbi:type IV secretion system protein IcmP/DotM [Yersinia enterocolitica]|nr:type IV secretion system protein IcmP/DotM [Yersinia enterocolitica]